MPEIDTIPEAILSAIQRIQSFVKETTGKEATHKEIASALTKYFVLNEIKEHIIMGRNGEG